MLTTHSFATADAPAPVEVLGSGAAAACLWGAQMAPVLPAAALLSAKQAHSNQHQHVLDVVQYWTADVGLML